MHAVCVCVGALGVALWVLALFPLDVDSRFVPSEECVNLRWQPRRVKSALVCAKMPFTKGYCLSSCGSVDRSGGCRAQLATSAIVRRASVAFDLKFVYACDRHTQPCTQLTSTGLSGIREWATFD